MFLPGSPDSHQQKNRWNWSSGSQKTTSWGNVPDLPAVLRQDEQSWSLHLHRWAAAGRSWHGKMGEKGAHVVRHVSGFHVWKNPEGVLCKTATSTTAHSSCFLGNSIWLTSVWWLKKCFHKLQDIAATVAQRCWVTTTSFSLLSTWKLKRAAHIVLRQQLRRGEWLDCWYVQLVWLHFKARLRLVVLTSVGS